MNFLAAYLYEDVKGITLMGSLDQKYIDKRTPIVHATPIHELQLIKAFSFSGKSLTNYKTEKHGVINHNEESPLLVVLHGNMYAHYIAFSSRAWVTLVYQQLPVYTLKNEQLGTRTQQYVVCEDLTVHVVCARSIIIKKR